MLLEGKKIIITGGVTGCGKATAVFSAAEGASVVTMSRALPEDARAKATTEECAKAGNGAYKHISLDVSDREACKKAVKEAVEFLGGLDALVCSHVINLQTPILDIQEKEMIDTFRVNTLGTMWMNLEAFNYLKENPKGGAIVNYSSVGGVIGIDGMPAYSTSKGGVTSMSRLLAREWGPYNVRVNQMLPAVLTELAKKDMAHLKETSMKDYQHYMDWVNNTIPLAGNGGEDKRKGPEEAAYMTAFLCSDYATYITGQMICVDGGMLFPR